MLLLHDGGGLQGSADRSATVRALPMVIDGLRARGFTFVARRSSSSSVPAYREPSARGGCGR